VVPQFLGSCCSVFLHKLTGLYLHFWLMLYSLTGNLPAENRVAARGGACITGPAGHGSRENLVILCGPIEKTRFRRPNRKNHQKVSLFLTVSRNRQKYLYFQRLHWKPSKIIVTAKKCSFSYSVASRDVFGDGLDSLFSE
jgi:hypothetical protein